MLTQAVILAGGRGSRLGPASELIPKPLQIVAGRPFIEYLLWNLKRFGIRRVILATGHLADQFPEHLGSGASFGLELEYSVESQPMGTGGALRNCAALLDEQALVLNGDTLFDFNYLDLALLLEQANSVVAIALGVVPRDAARFGTVRVNAGHTVTSFEEKSGGEGALINGGVYAIRRSVIDFLPDEPSSFERQALPALVENRKVSGKAYSGFFTDIGVPDALQGASTAIPRWQHKRAAFLDRDGVLNLDHGYVHRAETFQFVQDAPEAVKWLNDQGILVFVVTNQAGIARGLYTEAEFLAFTDWIQERLRAHGAHVDATYYCPHHPTEGRGEYRTDCTCRKPAPGLFNRAMLEWSVDVAGSAAIGDKESDMAAAQKAGIRAVRHDGGSLLAKVQEVFQ